MAEIICYHSVPGKLGLIEAFAQGCGAEVRQADDYRPSRIAVCFGMVKFEWANDPYPRSLIAGKGFETTTFAGARIALGARAAKVKRGASQMKARLVEQHQGPMILLERGFVRRDEYWGVGIGGLNGRGDFANAGAARDRWDALGVEFDTAWPGSKLILVCGQVPWDVSVQDTDHIGWIRRTVAELQAAGHEVLFRPHPEAVRRRVNYDPGCPISIGSLAGDLAKSHTVVTWNSNIGVDAALAGVPVIAMDRGSMVYAIAGHDLSEIGMVDRSARWRWAREIAYAQWTLDEMRAGLAWQHIRKGLE